MQTSSLTLIAALALLALLGRMAQRTSAQSSGNLIAFNSSRDGSG
jgi:hypothetical protein